MAGLAAAAGGPREPGTVVADGSAYGGKWAGFHPASPEDVNAIASTGVTAEALTKYLRASVDVEAASGQEKIEIHDRLMRTFVKARRSVCDSVEANHNTAAIDWASAEAMAFGAALGDGHRVRLCGQDA